MRKRLLACAACLLWASSTLHAQIVVIVNKVNSASELSLRGLSQIYKGKTEAWPSGKPVQLYNKKSTNAQCIAFHNIVIRKSPRKMKTYWMKRILGGEARWPKVLRTDAAMIRAVAAQEGAIGYISAANLDDNVKALKLDGLAYTDADYPLKE